jgi:hypothetical protein
MRCFLITKFCQQKDHIEMTGTRVGNELPSLIKGFDFSAYIDKEMTKKYSDKVLIDETVKFFC